MTFERISFIAGPMPEAQTAKRHLAHVYGDCEPTQADVVVALGGDGLMLQVLHDTMDFGKPIYGMNRGSIGFLMNEFSESELIARLENATPAKIHPLRMRAKTSTDEAVDALAINEVSLLRETRQTAKIRIIIDNKVRMEELICDGVLVATPAGSTAYNLSAHGPVLPIDASLFALTPISAFRPRRWRGALLPHKSQIRFEILESTKRPVSAVADHTEVRHVVSVDVAEDKSRTLTMLFDDGHSLEERILSEQFSS